MKTAPNMFDDVEDRASGPVRVDLRRIDPPLNMKRFYRMSLQADLSGGSIFFVNGEGSAAAVGSSLSSIPTKVKPSLPCRH